MPLPPILTAGYEGQVSDGFFAGLEAAGCAVLLDLRAVPLSRKPGFSKRVLAASAEARGIRYVHLQPLGTPKPGRDAVRAGRPAEMHRIYRAHLVTEAAQTALIAARDIVRSAPTCLLCFERDHTDCHRTLLAEAIAAETGQAIHHLLEPQAA